MRLKMLKKILNLNGAQSINKNEQKTMRGGIPECWIYALEAGCILISSDETCPLNTTSGICDTSRLCC
ncbi:MULTISPECIES: hypothetical protein [unclassified Flavobacterium]|jgi:hypothetical protein|uniref:hypothetical protein n=1 Tax=unclassified Flavobacterium TaxID=196869 RepID=UPI000FF8770B|nr:MULTISPECIES: hypothetical protein [unclassified Flavobacterium]MDQ1163834.1 hypothetical protein [Flavobacterium sp. SORGH_AS_0622]BDU24407.1 hypothetical protein FLGSB24_11510 [Flavobacterium sp. GSB-24]